jgi:tetratricopeptide (TPR) repeat protein
VPEITQDIVDKDHAFWSRFSERTIGNWITYDTSVKDVCAWAEKIYLQHYFAGFTGDRNFVRDDDAQKAFSKMRSAIGSSVYSWRSRNPHSRAERDRVLKEAEFALKQSFAYCPYSPESVINFMNLLLSENRLEDAILILQTCHKLDPYNGQINGLITQLEQSKNTAPDDQIRQLFGRVQAAIEARQTNAAEQMLDQVLRSPTTDPNIFVNVAAMYLRLGDLAKSEEAFQRLILVAPGSSQAWYNLALVQANRGKTGQAMASLKKSLELNISEIKQNPQMINLHERLFQDPGFAGLRQTPEFKAAFPAKP